MLWISEVVKEASSKDCEFRDVSARNIEKREILKNMLVLTFV